MAVENPKSFSTGLWKTSLISQSYHDSPRFVLPCDTCRGVHYIRRRQIFLVLYMSRREFPMKTNTKYTLRMNEEEMIFLRDLVRIGMKSKYFENYKNEEIDDYECEDIRLKNVICAQQFVNLCSVTQLEHMFDEKLFEGVTV